MSSSDGDGDGRLVELDRDECLALLGSVPVGRVVYTRRALPEIRPVNFVLLPDGVYLRTGSRGALVRAATNDAVVAFEVDDYDAQGRHGWSVVVLGRAALVTDARLLARLDDVPLVSYAASTDDEVVHIPLELVDGRRVGGPVRAHGGKASGTGGLVTERDRTPPPVSLVARRP